MFKNNLLLYIFAFSIIFFLADCSKSSDNGNGIDPTPPPVVTNEMDMWLTKANQSVLLQKQSAILGFTNPTNSSPFIDVDSAMSYQAVDGFGYTLTGGSAYLINHMSAASRSTLLNEFFGSSATSIGVSYLRISMGASDMSATVYSYDDMPAGQTDPTLANFSLSEDLVDLIPVLQEILTINPNIKILGSPWSPPAWMKDNENPKGGSLLPAYYGVYASYFVKYIQAMQAKGITVNAVTIQNEPQYDGNNPSMKMSALQQAEFIKTNLGPAFQAAGINTKIIIWDHNCDNANFPISILDDAAAKAFIDGSAFHLYAGDISALSVVHNAYPDKNLYFTEQYTSSNGNFGGDLTWHMKNVIIGSIKNWSKVALEWNLANDPAYGPHTVGGCTECKGAITISGSSYTKNVAYYIVAQAAKFIPPGSVRISSTAATSLTSVAFKRADGKKVLLVVNESATDLGFNIRYKGKWLYTSLSAGSTATYIW